MLSMWATCRLGVAILASLTLFRHAHADASDYFVHDLPGAPDGPLLKMHAGHIPTDPNHHGALFFWHFQNRHIGDRQRTVIWLNGGPGCSSMDGALMEIGPYRVRKGGKLEYNDGSWDEFSNLLFVDNPVGTGFSYVDTDAYLHDLKEMADQFVVFLERWFKLFPEYEHDDLYIAGESYAGQHIPYIASAILKHNTDPTKRKWNLQGLLIGNGWISPIEQYPSYTSFAYKRNLVESGSSESQRLEDQQLRCYRTMKQQPGYPNGKGSISIRDCENILHEILKATMKNKGPKDKVCLNMYDVRLRDEYPACGMKWPPDLENVYPYLRNEAVLRALNIDSSKKSTGWTECNGQVGANFTTRNSVPSVTLLPELLKQIPILLFSGHEDLICNHIGTEDMIASLTWNGGKGFGTGNSQAPQLDWTFEGEKVGYWQKARNLTYVLFYESSHMVPFDHPRRSRDMLDRFMGVDIASIGGRPTDSRVGDDPGVETSVGGHPNSTAAKEETSEKLQKAKWDAYKRSGEVVLIIVIIATTAWGWYIWRDRRRRSGYGRVSGNEDVSETVLQGVKDVGGGAMRLESFREHPERDLETGGNKSGANKYEVGRDSSDGGGYHDDDDKPSQNVPNGTQATS